MIKLKVLYNFELKYRARVSLYVIVDVSLLTANCDTSRVKLANALVENDTTIMMTKMMRCPLLVSGLYAAVFHKAHKQL